MSETGRQYGRKMRRRAAPQPEKPRAQNVAALSGPAPAARESLPPAATVEELAERIKRALAGP